MSLRFDGKHVCALRMMANTTPLKATGAAGFVVELYNAATSRCGFTHRKASSDIFFESDESARPAQRSSESIKIRRD